MHLNIPKLNCFVCFTRIKNSMNITYRCMWIKRCNLNSNLNSILHFKRTLQILPKVKKPSDILPTSKYIHMFMVCIRAAFRDYFHPICGIAILLKSWAKKSRVMMEVFITLCMITTWTSLRTDTNKIIFKRKSKWVILDNVSLITLTEVS